MSEKITVVKHSCQATRPPGHDTSDCANSGIAGHKI